MRRRRCSPGLLGFAAIHLGALGALFTPFRGRLAGMALALYLVRMLGVTAGYHRYFSHRSYRLGRLGQFLLAFLAESSVQKGVLWWAALHRQHHRHPDQPGDVHSPMLNSFWWSHVGWIISKQYDDPDLAGVADLGRFPELVWLDRNHWLPAAAAALAAAGWGALTGAGAWPALAWWAVSTVALYHATFSINSLAHLWGTRRFPTPDHSVNNLLLALLTLGEGWHNNHHADPGACSPSFCWWELDPTHAVLRVLERLGVASNLRRGWWRGTRSG